MNTERYLIRGGELVLPTETIRGDVLLDNERICCVGTVPADRTKGAQIVDAQEKLVLPGLIDLHVQGAGGSDFMQDRPDAAARVARHLASFGTTAFLATTVIDTTRDSQPHIDRIRDCMENDTPGAVVLGIHLEGPFINPEKRGMIQERFIYPPTPDRNSHVRDVCGEALRMMTVAPELDGALPVIDELRSENIVAALGHTNATYEQAIEGIQAGLSHVTHLANAMRGIHHRRPGALGAALMSDALSAQVMCDGAHLHPAFAGWVIRTKGPERCAVITDGMPAMGLPDGDYEYAGQEFTVSDGAARYEDGTLIGSALTQIEMMRGAADFADLPLHEAANMASLYPARILGIEDRKGSLEEGKDADVVLCDRNLNPEKVFVEGTLY